jgi:hypothetical protein
MRVVRGEGFAADGVTRVAYRDNTGKVVADAIVSDNVYLFATPPQDALPAEFVAFDASGDQVFVQPVSPGLPE